MAEYRLYTTSLITGDYFPVSRTDCGIPESLDHNPVGESWWKERQLYLRVAFPYWRYAWCKHCQIIKRGTVNHKFRRQDFYDSLTEEVAWILSQKFQVDCESKVQATQILVGAARDVIEIAQQPRPTESEDNSDRAGALLLSDIAQFLLEHEDLDVDFKTDDAKVVIRYLVDVAAEVTAIVQQHETSDSPVETVKEQETVESEEILHRVHHAHGEIEGTLSFLNGELFIVDVLTSQPVKMLFDECPAFLDVARSLIVLHRVYVFGEISSLEDGTKISIQVAEIERFNGGEKS